MKIVNTKHKSKTGNIFKLCFFNLLSMKITTYHNYYFQKYYRNSKICHTKVTIMITQINVALKKKSEVRIHQCIRSPAILHTTYKESSQCQELLATNEPGFFKMMGSTNIWLVSTDWWRKVSLKIVLIILIKWFNLLYFKVRN